MPLPFTQQRPLWPRFRLDINSNKYRVSVTLILSDNKLKLNQIYYFLAYLSSILNMSQRLKTV